MGLGFKQAGFRLAGAWDFDKYAVESYGNNVSPKVKQADITQMTAKEVPYADVWTFGFPCQDLSVAGKQAGMIKGQTRSGLFYEVMRLLQETNPSGLYGKPKVIMAENVKGLKPYLNVLKEEYDAAGYKMYYDLFNSKYWGVPQNRERYFVVGVRKDIDQEFIFPTQQTDFIPKLSSVLESEVDEKFYIDDLKAAKIIEQAAEGLRVKQATKKGYDIAVEGDSINISHPNSETRRGRVGKQVAQALLTGQEQVVVLKDVHACITPDRVDKRQNGRRAKDNEEEMYTLTSQDLHLSPTLTTSEGGHRQPKVLVSHAWRSREFESSGMKEISPTVCARDYKDPPNLWNFDNYKVRKLTPREYARLQGFPDEYKQVVSNSQFYKQMGNAGTVNVSKAIAEQIRKFLGGKTNE